MQAEVSASPEPVKVTPPKERAAKKPGRKPGQRNGSGNSSSLLRKRRASNREASKPQTEAERIEAIGSGEASQTGQAKPDAAMSEGPAKRRAKGATMGADKFAKSLQGLHKGAAFLAQTPELELDDSEAKMLADALYGIFEEYDIEISTKAAAAVNMAGAVMLVYGPRVAVLRGKAIRRAKAAKAPKMPDEKFNADTPKPAQPAQPPILDGMFENMNGFGG